ncbi:MAG: STAS domain-containing protein [Gaiellaceae bacterium]
MIDNQPRSYQTRNFGETTLVTVAGACDISNARLIEKRLLGTIDHGCRRLVVDLTEASCVDSSTVRALLRASLEMEAVSGRICLVHDARLARLLALVGVGNAFSFAGSRSEALRLAGAEGKAILLNMGAPASSAFSPRAGIRRGLRLVA